MVICCELVFFFFAFTLWTKQTPFYFRFLVACTLTWYIHVMQTSINGVLCLNTVPLKTEIHHSFTFDGKQMSHFKLIFPIIAFVF